MICLISDNIYFTPSRRRERTKSKFGFGCVAPDPAHLSSRVSGERNTGNRSRQEAPDNRAMNFCMGPQPRTDFPPFILWVPVIGYLAVMIPVRVSGAVRWQVRWVEA